MMMLSGAGCQIMFGNAILYLPLTIANVILCVLPFVNALGGFFLFREKLQRSTILAMIVSFGAVNLLALSKPAAMTQPDSEQSMSLQTQYFVGILFTIGALLSISAGNLTCRLLSDIDPMIL